MYFTLDLIKMKLQKNIWVVGLCLLGMLSSCGKKDVSPDQETILKGTITAKIDGVATTFQGATLKASDKDATVIFSTGVSNNNIIAFGVYAPTITSGGTYNTAATDDAPGAFIGYLTKEQAESGDDTGYVSSYNGTNGSVTITSITNDVVQGTFKGTLRFRNKGTNTSQTLSVTEGKFNLPMTNVADIPGVTQMKISRFKNSLK